MQATFTRSEGKRRFENIEEICRRLRLTPAQVDGAYRALSTGLAIAAAREYRQRLARERGPMVEELRQVLVKFRAWFAPDSDLWFPSDKEVVEAIGRLLGALPESRKLTRWMRGDENLGRGQPQKPEIQGTHDALTAADMVGRANREELMREASLIAEQAASSRRRRRSNPKKN